MGRHLVRIARCGWELVGRRVLGLGLLVLLLAGLWGMLVEDRQSGRHQRLLFLWHSLRRFAV